MSSRATFAGRLALVAATLLALACVDFLTSEHHAHRTPTGPARDVVFIAGQQLSVPPGFTVNLFADGIGAPRSMALGPGGAVFVALSDAGRIVLLVDTNWDGLAVSLTLVLGNLLYSCRLAFRVATVYF